MHLTSDRPLYRHKTKILSTKLEYRQEQAKLEKCRYVLRSSIDCFTHLWCRQQRRNTNKIPELSAAQSHMYAPQSFTNCSTDTSNSNGVTTSQTTSEWLKHARSIPVRLIQILTRLPGHFLDSLCSQYVASPTPTAKVFEKTREKVYLLLSSVRRCENVVLNESGYGDEVKEVLGIEGIVLLMLEWLDDILLAILDPDIHLEKQRRCGLLAYQIHGHYVLNST